jgi:hypothetical protein
VAEIPGFCEALPPASGSSPRTHSPILLEPSRSWHQAVNWRRSDVRLPGCTPVSGQGPHERHTLRALDGLRISEALGADIGGGPDLQRASIRVARSAPEAAA